jgi:tetratricopeptide (TPR) repeat protein
LAEYPAETRAAVEPVYKAAVSRPTDASAVGALGQTLQAWQELDAAHQAYRRAHTLSPTIFEWAYLDGIVLQRLARHEDAAAQFRRALEVTPGYLPARVRLAESLLKSGNLAESGRLFHALLSDPQAEALAQFGLGQIAASEGRHEVALTHLQRAVELVPEWGEAHYALAMSYLALKRREDASRALASHAQFVTTVPRLEDPVLASTAAIRDDAVASLARGVTLKQAGDIEGAIAAHEAAIARDPAYAQAHANLISLYGQVHNWAKVEEHYRAVVSLGFGLADANYDYGQAQELQGNWDLAEVAYRRAVAINPQHTAAYIQLGRGLERQKQFEAAAAEFRLAVASQPADRLARYDLGRMLMAIGKTLEAITELERTLEPRDDKTPACLMALAVAHTLAGHRGEASRRFAEARALATAFGLADVVREIDQTRETFSGARP